MTDRDTDTTLARLEGFLNAFEWLNSKTDHNCTFTVENVTKAADVPSALAAHFKLKPSDFQVEPLINIEADLRDVFARFLFLFREPAEGHEFGRYLVDPRRSFNLVRDDGRDSLLDYLIGVVRDLGTTAAWRVVASLECGALREWCFQDDVVIELPDRLCLLHFGVSD